MSGRRAGHVAGEPLVTVENADLPRTDVVWIQSTGNANIPLYVADIRIVAGPPE